MIRRDWLTVEVSGHQKVILQHHFKWKIDRKSIFGMLHHVRGFGLDLK